MPTPIILILGQGNAAFLTDSNAVQTACAGEGVAVTVVAVAEASRSVSLPNGAWNVVAGDGEDAPGALYTELLVELAALKLATPDAYIAGAIWLQGEQDTSAALDGMHYAPLTALFTQMRVDLAADFPEAPTFPILIQGLSEYQSLNAAGRDYVRSVHQQVAAEMADVHYIDTDAVIATHALSVADVMADSLYYTAAFFEHMADRFLEEPALRGTLGLDAASGDALTPTPGVLIIQKPPGAGSITTPGGQTLTTQNYGSAPPPPPTATAYPRLTGVQRMGETITLDDSMLTNVTSRIWFRNDIEDAGAAGSTTLVAGMMEAITCLVVADQGTFTTPVLRVLHTHSVDSHNAADNAVLALVGHGDATHIAIADGYWTDPTTWDVGLVPGAGANVLVPVGRTVTYDTPIAPRLDTIRVDGALTWALDRSTDMLVETIIVSPMGSAIIGDAVTNRVPAQFKHTITISNRDYRTDPDNPTDLNFTRDPGLLGRGVISLGRWVAFGHAREPFVKTAPFNLPMAGDTSAALEDAPSNWVVGDEIVIPGTTLNLDATGVNTRYDEQRVITDITGNVVSWADPLIYNHDGGVATANRPDYLALPIFTLERNIVIRSEGGGPTVHRRGHCMGMHGASEIDLWDVAFIDMGRTDKSIPTVTTDSNGDFRFIPRGELPVNEAALSYVTNDATANLLGRYPIHLHFTGFDKPKTDLIHGCLVVGAKAWGMVWHGCKADWIKNVMYRVQGAGMVGETGDETGFAIDNLAVGLETTVGNRGLPKNEMSKEGNAGDVATQGYGFFWRGRAIVANRNTAIGFAWGHVYYHRTWDNGFSDLIHHDRRDIDVHDLAWLGSYEEYKVRNVDYPISHSVDNLAIGCSGGMSIIKDLSAQGHDLNIIIEGFRAWGVDTGVALDYIATYILIDFDVMKTEFISQLGLIGGGRRMGLSMTKTNQLTVRNITTRNFREGIRLDATQPSTTDNSAYNSTTNPKIMIQNHVSLGDETAIAAGPYTDPLDDPFLYTLMVPANQTELPRPTVNLPLIIADYNGNGSSTPMTNIASGTKDDSISIGAPIPKGYDPAGVVDPNTDVSRFNEGTIRRRVLDILFEHGYHRYDDGSEIHNVVVVPLYFSDRLTGLTIKLTRFVRIVPALNSNFTNNGPYSFTTTPLTANDLTKTMPQDTTLSYNVLTDSGVTGGSGIITLGDPLFTGLFGPEPAHFKAHYGKLTVAEDGAVTYTPLRGYVGPDRWFGYAFSDGQFATIKTTIDVQSA